eukprot:COSAG02_NODE_66440_length_255_cov_0.903846_1_plen_22_part_01
MAVVARAPISKNRHKLVGARAW